MRNLYILALILFLISCKEETFDETPDLKKVEPVGRYQVLQLGTMRRDQVLLDTSTGKMWTKVCGHGARGANCDYSYWSPEDIIDITTTRELTNEFVDFLKKKKK